MAQELIDITGNEYGFLKVISFSHIGDGRKSFWKCECQRCGKVVTLRKCDFAYSNSLQKSCGCWNQEARRIRAKYNKNKTTGKFEKKL